MFASDTLVRSTTVEGIWWFARSANVERCAESSGGAEALLAKGVFAKAAPVPENARAAAESVRTLRIARETGETL